MPRTLSVIAQEFLREVSASWYDVDECWIYWENGKLIALREEGDKLVNTETGEVIG